MKIFGLGLTRTGTTSLAVALEKIGYYVVHYPSENYLFDGHYDAAFDLSVAIHYKKLDQLFVGSRFIYTIREKNAWLDSMERYLQDKRVNAQQYQTNRQLVYGQFEFDRKMYSAAYDRHHNDVLEYFKTRPQDLLTLNICNGDGWRPLLSFLGEERPTNIGYPPPLKYRIDVNVDAFPHKHQQVYIDA